MPDTGEGEGAAGSFPGASSLRTVACMQAARFLQTWAVLGLHAQYDSEGVRTAPRASWPAMAPCVFTDLVALAPKLTSSGESQGPASATWAALQRIENAANPCPQLRHPLTRLGNTVGRFARSYRRM